MFAAYEIGLDGLTAAEIKLAAAKARKRRVYAHAGRTAGVGGRTHAKGPGHYRVGRALGEAQRGYYETVEFDDPIVNAAIRNIGGWEYVTTIDDSANGNHSSGSASRRHMSRFTSEGFPSDRECRCWATTNARTRSAGMTRPSRSDGSRPDCRNRGCALTRAEMHHGLNLVLRHIGEALPLVQNT